jgi:hypothetical protein
MQTARPLLRKLEGFGVVLVTGLIILQVYHNGWALDQWAVIMVFVLVALIFVASYPEIIELRIGMQGLEIKKRAVELKGKLPAATSNEALTQVAEVKASSEDNSASFIKLWIRIEEILREIATSHSLDRRMPISALLSSLVEANLLDRDLLEPLRFLSDARNKVIHGEVRLDDEAASGLVELCANVIQLLS